MTTEDENRNRETEGTLECFLSNTRIGGECVDEKNACDPLKEQKNTEVFNFTSIYLFIYLPYLKGPLGHYRNGITRRVNMQSTEQGYEQTIS